MMSNIFNNLFIIVFILTTPIPVFARCAVCYTNGLSGASIAIMIIVASFIALFFANKFLKKILNKY